MKHIFMIIPYLNFKITIHQFQNMNSEIEQALNIALKRLVTQIGRNGELSKFEQTLQQRKQYDLCQRQYIQNQRLRKELGNEYQSSDSEQEKENHYNKLSQIQLKKLMRKTLIEKNFNEDVLAPIKQNESQHEPQIDQFMTTKMIADETGSNRQLNGNTQLNIIKQAKEIVEDEIEKQTNFGLQFLIYELERIQKLGVGQCLRMESSN